MYINMYIIYIYIYLFIYIYVCVFTMRPIGESPILSAPSPFLDALRPPSPGRHPAAAQSTKSALDGTP